MGLGSAAGSRILLSGGTPLKDAQGVPVVTRLALQELEKLSEWGGGELFLAHQPHLATLLLRRLATGFSSGSEGRREERTERFRLFLVLALLGLFLHRGARIIRWKETF